MDPLWTLSLVFNIRLKELCWERVRFPMLALWPGDETDPLPARSSVWVTKLSLKINAKKLKAFQDIPKQRQLMITVPHWEDSYRNPIHTEREGRQSSELREKWIYWMHEHMKIRKQWNMPSSVSQQIDKSGGNKRKNIAFEPARKRTNTTTGIDKFPPP